MAVMKLRLRKVLFVVFLLNAAFLLLLIYSRLTRNEESRRILFIWNQSDKSEPGEGSVSGSWELRVRPWILANEKKYVSNGANNIDIKTDKQSENNLHSLSKTRPRTKVNTYFPYEKGNNGTFHFSTCRGIRTPVRIIRDESPQTNSHYFSWEDSWQTVSKSNSYYVFSAYYDAMGTTFWKTGKAISPVIRIIGASSEIVLSRPLYCHLWYNSTARSHVQRAILTTIPENHMRNFSATYFICPLPRDAVPFAVSIVTDTCGTPSNFMYIHFPPEGNLPDKNFTVCVTPLNMEYNSVTELIQMLEGNQLFGADSIMFYNYSTGYDVHHVLFQYLKERSVQVIQWHLPMKVDTWPPSTPVEIHYFGQLAALNDCLYRNMYSSKYTVFTDLDEVIVPKKHNNWSAMMNVFPESAAYHFRCTFFRKEWPNTNENFTLKADASKYHIDYLLKLQRESVIMPVFRRSKFIVDPLKVETVGIHSVWALRPGFQAEHIVDDSIGILHHYRNWNRPSDSKRTLDKTMLRFSSQIISRVKRRWKQITNASPDTSSS